ncbi:MAG: hypothetical protein WCD13_22105, partial [Pseudolabrys sp.]
MDSASIDTQVQPTKKICDPLLKIAFGNRKMQKLGWRYWCLVLLVNLWPTGFPRLLGGFSGRFGGYGYGYGHGGVGVIG